MVPEPDPDTQGATSRRCAEGRSGSATASAATRPIVGSGRLPAVQRASCDVLVIDIGAGTTDLCRMHGTMPADDDQISLPIAGDAIDRKLLEIIRKRYPQAQININMCKQIKLYATVFKMQQAAAQRSP